MPTEANARILINDLLHKAGRRFFDAADGRANVRLESHVKVKKKTLDALGSDVGGRQRPRRRRRRTAATPSVRESSGGCGRNARRWKPAKASPPTAMSGGRCDGRDPWRRLG